MTKIEVTNDGETSRAGPRRHPTSRTKKKYEMQTKKESIQGIGKKDRTKQDIRKKEETRPNEDRKGPRRNTTERIDKKENKNKKRPMRKYERKDQ